VEDLDQEPVGEDDRKKGMPAALLAVDDYLSGRVREQIEWYRRRAAEHRAVARRIKSVSLWLGVAAVVLGVVGAQWTPSAAFVAVITTITTSLASYLYAGRYQYLVVSYLATAHKLEERILGWELSGKTEAERKQFVLDCENIFAAENSGWMAELSSPKPQVQAGQASSGQEPPPPAPPTPPASHTPPPPADPQGNGTGGAVAEGEVVGERVEEGVVEGGGAQGAGHTAGDPGDGT
jgi:hypothetical protein